MSGLWLGLAGVLLLVAGVLYRLGGSADAAATWHEDVAVPALLLGAGCVVLALVTSG